MKKNSSINQIFRVSFQKFMEMIVDIPENPGFIVMFIIGLFGFFESNNQGVQSLIFGDGNSDAVQALMFGSGFWGLMSSIMMKDPEGHEDETENDYWINFWLLCHLIKFIIFLVLCFKLVNSYGITRIAVYLALIIIDLVIINNAIYKTKKTKKIKTKIIQKINNR